MATASTPATAVTPDGPGRTPGAAGDCPATSAEPGRRVAIDYVDFVHWGGREYLSVTPDEGWGSAPITPVDLGSVVFVVGCSYTRLNDLTLASPPPPGDRDASYLAAGTPVYAVRGWPTSCRLAAVPTDQPAGTVHLYAALDPAAPTATPATCIPTSAPLRSMPAALGPDPRP